MLWTTHTASKLPERGTTERAGYYTAEPPSSGLACLFCRASARADTRSNMRPIIATLNYETWTQHGRKADDGAEEEEEEAPTGVEDATAT